MDFQRVVILDIDGLRRDVFLKAISESLTPNLCSIVCPNGINCSYHVPAVSVAPSITFTAQASIFTGAHPGRHRISGNNFFDRIGHITRGVPRHYALDGGDTYEIMDAIQAFRNDLSDRLLNPNTPTVYESVRDAGKTSIVAANMYNRGAQIGLLPSVLDMARVFLDYGPIKMTPEDCDDKTLDTLIQYFQVYDIRPDLLTFYFVGMDLHSHNEGPGQQMNYLCNVIDGQIGRLVENLRKLKLFEGTLFVVVSDHGQSPTPGDDAHTLRLGFPFDMELTPLFHKLGLDLYDMPSEGHDVDAVVGLNGGLGYVYLRNRKGSWPDYPRYEEDVLRVAQAFHRMNQNGDFRSELRGTLEMILVRNSESGQNWIADYQAYLGDGKTQPLAEWLERHPELPIVDGENRIRNAISPLSGDIILGAKAEEGVYFGVDGLKGVHGSLHAQDSNAVLTFSMPTGTPNENDTLRQNIDRIIQERCRIENNRQPSIVDMSYVLRRLWLKQEECKFFPFY